MRRGVSPAADRTAGPAVARRACALRSGCWCRWSTGAAPLDWCEHPGPVAPGEFGFSTPLGPRLGPGDRSPMRTRCWCRPSPSTGTGRRLGRGGGHYDRTLELLRRRLRGDRLPPRIALIFDDELLDAVPFDALDQPVTAVVDTRLGIHRAGLTWVRHLRGHRDREHHRDWQSACSSARTAHRSTHDPAVSGTALPDRPPEDLVPTYQYACTECGHRFEAVQAFTDDSLTTCPVCGGQLRKVYGSVGVVFKGSGFYRTDSRAGASSTAPAAGEKGGGDKSGGSDKSGADGGGKKKAADRANPPALPDRHRPARQAPRLDRPVPPEVVPRAVDPRAGTRPRQADRRVDGVTGRYLIMTSRWCWCPPGRLVGLLGATSLLVGCSSVPSAPAPVPTTAQPDLRISTVATGLDVPWGLAFLPDGRPSSPGVTTHRSTSSTLGTGTGTGSTDATVTRVGTVDGVVQAARAACSGSGSVPDLRRRTIGCTSTSPRTTATGSTP